MTGSLRYTQSNVQVEHALWTIKGMLNKSNDPYLAVFSYRATSYPWCGRSPAEVCVGRNVRSTVPQAKFLLIPQCSYLPKFRKENADFKQIQKVQFDSQHWVSEQDSIPDSSDVWVMSESDIVPGIVVSAGENPRSYIIETPTMQVLRNRAHLHVLSECSNEEQSSDVVSTP